MKEETRNYEEIINNFIKNINAKYVTQEPTFNSLEDVVNLDGKNVLSSLDTLSKSKLGLYIFKDDGLIVYIGKGGTGRTETSTSDLKDRIGEELREHKDVGGNDSQTLSKNIKSENRISGVDSVEIIQRFTLAVIPMGDRFNEHGKLNIKLMRTAEILELALISQFNPKYNKT